MSEVQELEKMERVSRLYESWNHAWATWPFKARVDIHRALIGKDPIEWASMQDEINLHHATEGLELPKFLFECLVYGDGTTLTPDCQVCESEGGMGVASVPGIPMSLSFGVKCLKAQCAGPFSIHLANLASFCMPDDEEEYTHERAIHYVHQGMKVGLIADHALEMIVYHEGEYKTMREAIEYEEELLEEEDGDYTG